MKMKTNSLARRYNPKSEIKVEKKKGGHAQLRVRKYLEKIKEVNQERSSKSQFGEERDRD